MRATHTVRTGGATLRFEADMFNLLNFLNSDWGTIRFVRTNTPLLEAAGRASVPEGISELYSRWGGGLVSDGAGGLTTPEPWSVATPDSQWQAQFGVRVTFGR